MHASANRAKTNATKSSIFAGHATAATSSLPLGLLFTIAWASGVGSTPRLGAELRRAPVGLERG